MKQRRFRRGATVVEGTIVLGVFLLFVFGALDVGLAVLRSNAVSEAARRGARCAIVHGNKASLLGPLGPATLNISAADANPIAQSVRQVLPTINPAEVQIEVQWLDGANQPDRRVRVAIAYVHQPLTFVMAGWDGMQLTADSTMLIAH